MDGERPRPRITGSSWSSGDAPRRDPRPADRGRDAPELLAGGDWPPDETGARSPLLLDGEVVGYSGMVAAGRVHEQRLGSERKPRTAASSSAPSRSDAELLADARGAALFGARPETEALVEYEQRRNTATRSDYDKNVHLASGKPVPPQVLAARAQVRGESEATRTYFLTGEGRLE
jgi:hypothetical protein